MEAVLEKKIKPMRQPSFDVGVVPIGFGKRIYNVLFLLKIRPTAFVKSRSGDLARLFAEMMGSILPRPITKINGIKDYSSSSSSSSSS